LDPVRVVAASPWRSDSRVSRQRLLDSSTTTAAAAGLVFARGPAAPAESPITVQPPLTQVALDVPLSIPTAAPARSATFKESLLGLLAVYCSPSNDTGWIVPKACYEQIGPDGFTPPIGVGPFQMVKPSIGTEVELEAFTDHWRRTPSVKKIITPRVMGAATRLAMLQPGEAEGHGGVKP